MQPDSSRFPAPSDVTTCDREPIHIPGAIQPHGLLMVLQEPELEIIQLSDNAEAFFGERAASLLGRLLPEVFSEEDAGAVAQWAEQAASPEPPAAPVLLGQVLQAGVPGRTPASTLDALLHRTADGLVLEVEPSSEPTEQAPLAQGRALHRAITRLHRASDVTELCRITSEEIRRLTGFDRVKVYRFDADWHGEVVAESRADHMTSYLGQHFPASDIPQQARRLYALNRIRLIPDVDYTPVRLVPELNPNSEAPLDMSFCTLRSVSPIHIEYLKNMEVGASMSVSIVHEDRLWGLIACHHATRHRVSYDVRATCEVLAEVLALLLITSQESEDRLSQARRRNVQARLLEAMVRADDFARGLVENASDLMDLAGATGAAVLSGTSCLQVGQTPSEEDVRALAAWLETQPPAPLFETNRLSRLYPPADTFKDVASGILAISLSRLQRYYVFWFRPEVLQTILWAGNPTKAVRQQADELETLHPRASFQAWKEIVRGMADPWTSSEQEAARELRRSISDVVFVKLEKLAQLNASLSRFNERLQQEIADREQAESALHRTNVTLQQRNQELQDFAYIASHDLQEPLRKIRSFGSLLLAEAGADLDENARLYLDRMTNAAARMSVLIAELLSFSRVVTQGGPLKNTNLRDEVEAVLSELEGGLLEAKAEVMLEGLPTLRADPSQMRTLFHHLVSNAIKFRRPAVPLRLHITSEPYPTEIMPLSGSSEAPLSAYSIRVTDNGIGFEEKYADRIFLPFQRLHPRDAYPGTGMGLAICKRIVERHDGAILAESTPGNSTTIVIILPAPLLAQRSR